MLGSLEKNKRVAEEICGFFLTISVYLKFLQLSKVWLSRSLSKTNHESSHLQMFTHVNGNGVVLESRINMEGIKDKTKQA